MQWPAVVFLTFSGSCLVIAIDGPAVGKKGCGGITIVDRGGRKEAGTTGAIWKEDGLGWQTTYCSGRRLGEDPPQLQSIFGAEPEQFLLNIEQFLVPAQGVVRVDRPNLVDRLKFLICENLGSPRHFYTPEGPRWPPSQI